VAADAPAAVRRLGQQGPGAARQAWALTPVGDDVRQSADGRELLVTVEDADGGEGLDAHCIVFWRLGVAKGDVRARMVAGAARLLAEKGMEGTSFAEVLAATGAPRGSTYHHFPGGKTERALGG